MKKQDSNKQDKDIFGMAISAYYHQGDPTDIIVHSPDFDDDIIPINYLFRDYKEMPPLERKALDLSKGKVLDVGCGAGSHALFLQNEKKLPITAIDISEGAVKIAALRGIEDARKIDFFDLKNETFDTLLFLMNGTGIIGQLKRLDTFFDHARRLLNPGGRILIDSSDLSYLLDTQEDGGVWINMDAPYYGELEFRISYKGETSAVFHWLYLDYNTLRLGASKNNFTCRLVKQGEHYNYLAELTQLPH